MWHEEYLLSPRESYKDLHEIEFSNKININDVILIKNPAIPRPFGFLAELSNYLMVAITKFVRRGNGTMETHSLKHLYALTRVITNS